MAVFSLRRFLREQWSTLPPLRAVGDVSSKTYMVTGSNVGLGFEACVHLAKMEPRLLLATSRDAAKCTRTRQAILERTGSGTRVDSWPLDLTSFESVRSFVDRFAAQGGGALDAFIANAGLYCPEYGQTSDGWEVTLQVNYLSTALLSILLLPYLVNASTGDSVPRLVVVSSLAHYLGDLRLKDSETWTNILETINGQKFGFSIDRYNVTKLLEVVFVRELAARLPDPSPIVACTVNPGYCRSSLFRAIEDRWYIRYIYPVFQRMLFVRPTEEGAKALVQPAVAGGVRSMHGRYLSCCQVTEESDFVFTPQGKAFSARLWDETIAVLSCVDDRVPEIVAKYLRTDT